MVAQFNDDPFGSGLGQGLGRADGYPFAGQADVALGDATLRDIFGESGEVDSALAQLWVDSSAELSWGTAIRQEPPAPLPVNEGGAAEADIIQLVRTADMTDPMDTARLLSVVHANMRAANAAPYPSEVVVGVANDNSASSGPDPGEPAMLPALRDMRTEAVRVVDEVPEAAVQEQLAIGPASTTYSLRAGEVRGDPIDRRVDAQAPESVNVKDEPEVIIPDAVLTNTENIGKPFKLFRLFGGATRFAKHKHRVNSGNPAHTTEETVVSAEPKRRFSGRRIAALALAGTLLVGLAGAYLSNEQSGPKVKREQAAPGAWVPETVKFWQEKIDGVLNDQNLADRLASIKAYPLVIDSQLLEAIILRVSGGDPHAENGLMGIPPKIGNSYFGNAYDPSDLDQNVIAGTVYYNTRYVQAIQAGKSNNNRKELVEAVISGDGNKDGLELFPGDPKRTAQLAKDIAAIDHDWSKTNSGFFTDYAGNKDVCRGLLGIYNSFREQGLVPAGKPPCAAPKEKN